MDRAGSTSNGSDGPREDAKIPAHPPADDGASDVRDPGISPSPNGGSARSGVGAGLGLCLPGVSVELCRDEAALMGSFVRLVLGADPDMLSSYEVQAEGLGYVVDRAKAMGIDLCLELSRVHNVSREEEEEKRERERRPNSLPFPTLPPNPTQAGNGTAPADDGPAPAAPQQSPAASLGFGKDVDEWGYNYASGMHIPGRVVLNVWRVLKSEVKTNSYSLGNVAKAVLGWRSVSLCFACVMRCVPLL